MGEYRGLRRDGSIFYFEVNGAALRDVSGAPNGFVFILRDISERKRLESEQHRRVQELEALQATLNDISSKLDLPKVLNSIVERVVTLLVVGQCEVGLYDSDNNLLKVVISHNLERDYTGVTLAMGEGVMGKAAQSRKMVSVDDYSSWEGRSSQYDAVHTNVIAVPLVTQGELLGVLSVGTDPNLRKFDENDINLIEVFAQQAAVAIQNAKLFSEVQRLAITDSLTGLHNRGAFFDRSRQEFSRSERYHDPLSLIMLDVDHFKRINDRFGHAAGDKALQVIAGLCLGTTRVADLSGRYGGEEFVILLPETDIEGAEKTARRLCEEIRGAAIQSERGEIRVTVSVGVAQVTPEVNDLDELLDFADQAMYRAKQGGRDRVSR
jgi:diguanylate cyclase (GGDEF)-like protein